MPASAFAEEIKLRSGLKVLGALEEGRAPCSPPQEHSRSSLLGSVLPSERSVYKVSASRLLSVRPDHRGAKVSERRPENTLFTHVANQLCPGIGGPFSSPEADNLLAWTPVP